MRTFSVMFQKIFGQLLKPYGYKRWKSVFYNEVDANVCFFVYAKQNILSREHRMIEVLVDAVPYCADLQLDEYEPQECGINITNILRLLTPEVFMKENIVEYFSTRFVADTEEAARNSLNNLCSDMKNTVLPYLHKMVDLEYYYDELYKMWDLNENDQWRYANYFIYGLSLKLHKYKNAIPYMEHQLEWHGNVLARSKSNIVNLRNGDIVAYFNTPVSEEFVSKLLKKRPNFAEGQIGAIKKRLQSQKTGLGSCKPLRLRYMKMTTHISMRSWQKPKTIVVTTFGI